MDDLNCTKCGAGNKPPPAKPTLEREPDGSVTCSCCGSNFPLPPEVRTPWTPAYRASHKHRARV